MNIIKERQCERARRITELRSQIKAYLRDEDAIVKKDFVIHYCEKWGISKRTVSEYFEVAWIGVENERQAS